MGLDMYLEKKTYVKNWDFMKPEERYTITVKQDGLDVSSIDPENISYITEEVGYWRKANQIHKWFVDNVQDGNDDCGDYYVSREQLQELLALCKKVKENSKMVPALVSHGYSYVPDGKGGHTQKHDMQPGNVIANPAIAEELLPAQEGFFFGNTDYDEYYMEDIEHTIEILENALKHTGTGNFYYSSSW